MKKNREKKNLVNMYKETSYVIKFNYYFFFIRLSVPSGSMNVFTAASLINKNMDLIFPILFII